MFNYIKTLLLIAFTCLNATADASVIERWQETNGTFVTKHTTLKEANSADNTVVGQLIKLNNMDIKDVLAEDGKTIHYFSISYNIPVGLSGKKSKETKRITQYGLYRTLDTELRTDLKNHGSPLMITVRYDQDNPASFKFVINNTVFSTPLLVTGY